MNKILILIQNTEILTSTWYWLGINRNKLPIAFWKEMFSTKLDFFSWTMCIDNCLKVWMNHASLPMTLMAIKTVAPQDSTPILGISCTRWGHHNSNRTEPTHPLYYSFFQVTHCSCCYHVSQGIPQVLPIACMYKKEIVCNPPKKTLCCSCRVQWDDRNQQHENNQNFFHRDKEWTKDNFISILDSDGKIMTKWKRKHFWMKKLATLYPSTGWC